MGRKGQESPLPRVQLQGPKSGSSPLFLQTSIVLFICRECPLRSNHKIQVLQHVHKQMTITAWAEMSGSPLGHPFPTAVSCDVSIPDS